MKPLVAVDASEALAILEKHPFDLVLTDLNLPGMSGLDLLKQNSNRVSRD